MYSRILETNDLSSRTTSLHKEVKASLINGVMVMIHVYGIYDKKKSMQENN